MSDILVEEMLDDCESALIAMVQQYCYDREDADAEHQTYSHNFMSAGEEAFNYLVGRRLAKWTDEKHHAIEFVKEGK